MSLPPVSQLITTKLELLEKSYGLYEGMVGKLGQSCSTGLNGTGGTLKEPRIEAYHQKIMLQYARFKNNAAEFQELCKNTTTGKAPRTFQIYEENLPSFQHSTDLQERALKLFRALNHTARTNYPLAQIAEPEVRVGGITSTNTLINPPKGLEKCSHFRKILGDGNCFFTSFTVRFLETFIKEPNYAETIFKFIESREDGLKNDTLRTFISTKLQALQKDPSLLETLLKDNQVILPFVRYFRAITANELIVNQKEHQETFAITLAGDFPRETDSILSKDYGQLVNDYVSTMGKDATHNSIGILCRKLNFPCRIYSQGIPKPVDAIDGLEPKALFVRKDEHYFVAYTQADKVKEEKEFKDRKMTGPAPKRTNVITDEELFAKMKKTSIISTESIGPATTLFSFRYNAGSKNKLFIRGEGTPELNWSKGVELNKIGDDEWVWESAQADLSKLQFKVLLNDKTWEKGTNHTPAKSGQENLFTPKF